MFFHVLCNFSALVCCILAHKIDDNDDDDDDFASSQQNVRIATTYCSTGFLFLI